MGEIDIAEMPFVAVVREDGSEDGRRAAWLNTRLNAELGAVVGDDVNLEPAPGRYVAYRVYSGSGRLISPTVKLTEPIDVEQSLRLSGIRIYLLSHASAN